MTFAKVLATTTAFDVIGAGVAIADTSGKKIALSNNYAGNSWRQAMLKSWDQGHQARRRAGRRARRRTRSPPPRTRRPSRPPRSRT